MKKRVCILGNSHTAALKQAWDELAGEYPGIEVTFFAAPGRHIGQTAVRDGAIIATSDYTRSFFERLGGSAEVRLDRFDDFVVVGCSVHIGKFLDLMQANHPFRYLPDAARQRRSQNPEERTGPARANSMQARPSLLQSVRSLFSGRRGGRSAVSERRKRSQKDSGRDGRGRLVSHAVFREMAFSVFGATNAARLINGASRQEGLKIFYVATPFPSSAIVGTTRGRIFSRLIASGSDKDAAVRFWETLEAFLAPRATLVRQPRATLENHILTRAEFARDSVGLAPNGEKHPEEELQHMNASYGRAMMTAVMEAIGAEQTNGDGSRLASGSTSG